MSYTPDQLAALEAAYIAGVSEVTLPDGKRIRYATMADMRTAIREIRAQLQPAGQRLTHVNPVYDRGY